MSSNIYWIDAIQPLSLAIMPRPLGGDALEDEVLKWKRSGIDSIVSLLPQVEMNELEISPEESMCLLHGIAYHNFPIADFGLPEPAADFFILVDRLVKDVKEGNVVAVHCRAGIGRSGLTVASILLNLGISSDQVFAVIEKARGVKAPDTDSQLEWFHSVVVPHYGNHSYV